MIYFTSFDCNLSHFYFSGSGSRSVLGIPVRIRIRILIYPNLVTSLHQSGCQPPLPWKRLHINLVTLGCKTFQMISVSKACPPPPIRPTEAYRGTDDSPCCQASSRFLGQFERKKNSSKSRKIQHSHISIFKGFRKEIFYNKTKFKNQKKLTFCPNCH